MIGPKAKFQNEADIEAFVSICEADFEARLNAVVEKVRSINGLKLIGLSGPTCSGKTTLSNKLIENFARYGRTVHIISIDNFYHDRKYLVERSKKLGLETIDYDSIDTIDFEELSECVREIFTEDETLVPMFDFVEGRVTGFKHIEYEANELFIFEGIQAIYPEIVDLLNDYNYCSMVICPLESLDVDGTIFEPNEIRLMRRLVRDFKFRGSSPERTFEMWTGVRQNEDKNIFPNLSKCDFVINSTMPYELNILAPYLKDILEKLPPNSIYQEKARKILKKIENIQGISSEKYIIGNSLYREFVG